MIKNSFSDAFFAQTYSKYQHITDLNVFLAAHFYIRSENYELGIHNILPDDITVEGHVLYQ